MTRCADKPQRTCLELGLCQNRRPLCDDCMERPLHRFAPGVIDGPYRRESRARVAARKAGAGIGLVVAWLMGPHP